MKKKNFRAFNTKGVKYKLVMVGIVALIVLGVGIAAVVTNPPPGEHADKSINASEHKLTKHEKPVGFGTKILAITSDKYKEKVNEKIAEKIAEKTNGTKITINIANATYVNATGIKIGAKVNVSEINITDVTGS